MLLTILCVAGAGRRSKYEYGAAPNQGLLSAPQRTLGCRWYNSGYYAPGLHHVNWALNSKLYLCWDLRNGLVLLPGFNLFTRPLLQDWSQGKYKVLSWSWYNAFKWDVKRQNPVKVKVKVWIQNTQWWSPSLTLLRLGQARVTVSQSGTVAV